MVENHFTTYTGLPVDLPANFRSFSLPVDHWLVTGGERALSRALGRPVPIGVWRFATDGGQVAALSIPTVGFGPGDPGWYTPTRSGSPWPHWLRDWPVIWRWQPNCRGKLHEPCMARHQAILFRLHRRHSLAGAVRCSTSCGAWRLSQWWPCRSRRPAWRGWLRKIGEGKVIGWRTFVEGVRRFWKRLAVYVWGCFQPGCGCPKADDQRHSLPHRESRGRRCWRSVRHWACIWSQRPVCTSVFAISGAPEPPPLKTAYRNGLVLMLSQPFLISLTVFLVVAVLTAASYLLLSMFLFYFVFLSLLANRAVIKSIKAQREAEEAAAEREASSHPDRRWKP